MVQAALAAAADSPGYPLTVGRADTRQAAVDWLARRFGVTGLDVGRGAAGDRLQGADRLAADPPRPRRRATSSCTRRWPTRPTRSAPGSPAPAAVATDSLTSVGPERVTLVWVNSPSNPTGRVLPVDHLRKVVAWCRERGALLVSDECYLEWRGRAGRPRSRCCTPTSATGTTPGSSRCTRCPSAPTWPATAARSSPATPPWWPSCSRSARTSACRCPGPQQHAMRAALDDDAHVEEQHARYARRRGALRAALEGAGFRVDALRGVAVPVGDPRRALLGHGRLARRPGHPGRAGGVLRRGRRRARAGGVHRHRRAGRGRRTTAGASRAARRSRLLGVGIGRAAIGVRCGAAANTRTAETLPIRITECSASSACSTTPCPSTAATRPLSHWPSTRIGDRSRRCRAPG